MCACVLQKDLGFDVSGGRGARLFAAATGSTKTETHMSFSYFVRGRAESHGSSENRCTEKGARLGESDIYETVSMVGVEISGACNVRCSQ